MALTLAQRNTLRAEWTDNTKPLYSALQAPLAAGDTDSMASLLNARTGAGAQNIYRNDIQPFEVVNAIVATDFAALSQLQVSKLAVMLSPGFVDASMANVRTIFVGIFSGMTNTVSALNALAQRLGSRVEFLFGFGVVVDYNDISLAIHNQ